MLQFHPVAVRQGTETNESSLASTGVVPLHSDEVRIEKFALDEKQHQLRHAFVSRSLLMFGRLVQVACCDNVSAVLAILKCC